MNIDYAFFQAINLPCIRQLPGVINLYDVSCNWIVHFEDMVRGSEYLSIPDFVEGFKAVVGKFHIHAHIPSCFVRFSPNFIKGIGMVDRETVETLWSTFNAIAKLAKPASKAHRHELYDDYMRDTNWKKLVRMGELASFDNTRITMILPMSNSQAIASKIQKGCEG